MYDYDGIIIRLQSHFERVIVDCAELYCFPKNCGFKKKSICIYICNELSVACMVCDKYYANVIFIHSLPWSFYWCTCSYLLRYLYLFVFQLTSVMRITIAWIQSFHIHTGYIWVFVYIYVYIACAILAKCTVLFIFFQRAFGSLSR